MQSIDPAVITIVQEASSTTLRCSGSWTLSHLGNVERLLKTLRPASSLIWDVREVSELDSAGISLYQVTIRTFEEAGIPSTFIGANEDQTKLYHLLYPKAIEATAPPPTPSWLYTLGVNTHRNIQGIGEFLAFLGEAFVLLYYTLFHPSQIRYRSIVAHIYTTGVQALPIIAISSFLIGVVIAYQTIVQLQKFGADIFIVDTIGISLTRELAPLITAIVVAGRSGSAFTAQIGAMKMTQEIDAMRTMGFDPFTFLVWPRVFALMIVMPLLIFFADIIGIFGGMVVAQAESHLSFGEFIHRLQGALALKHYLIGIVKGPFFAYLIAIVSTYRGFQVSLNTESIGHYTTKSVVNSIFLVIACDALFSILLTELRV
ncbi:ABC transporter permease [Sulfuricurvum sp.]|uniref:ABC transporter permease n=1 Tax=Sulfuricurvum sp. TaxID=2025608 RepID=UPI003C38741E